MIISCGKCNTGFFVSPAQIGPSGRRVKCSKCKHIWHASLPQYTVPKKDIIASRVEIDNSFNRANLPAIIPFSIPNALFIAPIALIMLISFTLWVFYPNFTSKIGLGSALSGLIVEDIKYDYDESNKVIHVEYSLVNKSSTIEQVPLVQVKLLDKNDSEISKVYIKEQGVQLNSGSSVVAEAEFTEVSEIPKTIEVSLGNLIKFWFR